jgi:PKD repeat protein
MKKNPASQSGLFNRRVLLASCLCSVGALLAMLSFASTPSSGTLTDTSGPFSYTAGPFFVSNPTPIIELDSGPECGGSSQPCDDFALTVNLPTGYTTNFPNASVKVTLSWTDSGSGSSDYDLYIYKTPRTDCNPTDCTRTDGGEPADYQSASSNNPEIATISPLHDGTQTYTIVVVPYTATGETVHVTAELMPGSGSAGGVPGFGGPDPTAPGVPRYQNFYAPDGSSAQSSAGEFNIGYNPKTGRIMNMNLGPVWRITPPELLTPAKPECCEGLWEDKDNPATNTGLDPILFTDQKTGRTFVSNSTAGANAVYGFSDNDGDTWVPLAASPPNGGSDHETIGSGPYPASLSALSTPVNQGEAVYYCSQTFPLGPAACQRSDTLGANYGPGVFAYFGNGITQCHGLHGHVHVAPDGTVWLPVNQCAGQQGGAFSTDGGVTWHEFIVPNAISQAEGADPSIAIDANSRIYYSYVNNQPVPAGQLLEGHARVAVGTLNKSTNTITWSADIDIGASHGIKNAAEIEAVGGSPGRAAVGFPGTDIAGDYQAISFPGKWYIFIATTYDGGQSWVTVNATPNDPVQSMTGIWQQGGSHQDRNLLDFNEVTVDKFGRVLFGYSDGCVTDGCIAGTAPNDFTAFMRVARQSGGKTLFASFDGSTDTTAALPPKPPCLSGTRDPSASHLSWKVPDNGGSDITGYQILRGTSSGGETVLVNNTGNTKPSYDDTTADPSVAHYFYTVKAINNNGTVIGLASNEINLVVVVPPPPENVCALPGLTKLTDPSGDTSAILGIVTTPAPPGSDLLSFQLAQPFAADNVIRLAFTINTDNGESPQPMGSSWYVAMKIPDPAPATTFHYKAVHMTWNGTTPTFESYTPAPNGSGGVDGRFVTSGSQKPAEPSSGYAPPFNKVVIVVKASDLGLNPGDSIAGFVSGVSQTAGGVITGLYDQMPDSLAFTGSYTVNSNAFCQPNNPPTAVLTANPTSGPPPLTVNFDGSGSSDPDSEDHIASYTFKFGDGQSVTQSTPTVSHTYNKAGTYGATLTVTDSHGAQSANAAEVTITVSAPDLIVSTLKAANTQAPQGAKIPITATISNIGQANAGTSHTKFVLDGSTVLGDIATPAIPAQTYTSVTVTWNTAGVKKGNHTISATADSDNEVAESDETNNTSAPVTIYIQGNQSSSPTPTPTATPTPTPKPHGKP